MRLLKNKTISQYYNKCIEDINLDFRTLKFDTKDPHIDYLIKSFALINADLKYNLEYKIDQTFKNILLNVFYDIFGIIPSVGILSVQPERHIYLANKTILRSANSSIFRTKFEIHLQNTQIMNYNISFNNLLQKYYLQVELNGSFNGDLFFYCNLDLINSIFSNNNIINCEYTIHNYKESSECVLIEQNNLKSFCWFPEQFCFFKVSMNVIDQTTLYIPLSFNCEPIIKINCIPVENSFVNSDILHVNKKGYYNLISNDNETIYQVNSVLCDEKEMNHIRDGNGWLFLNNSDNCCVYFDQSFNEEKELLVNYNCYNKEVSIEELDFEEFLPVKITWVREPLPIKEIDSYDVHIQLLKCLFLQQQKTENHFELIKSMMNIFNNTFGLNDSFTDIQLNETVKPMIKKINNMNFSICKIGIECTMQYSGSNYLLLYQIINELQKYNENFIYFNIVMPEKTFYRR